MQILITGGAGNIGASLARLLIQDPENYVVIVDNFTTGSYEKLPDQKNTNWRFIKADVNNFEDISSIVVSGAFDYIFHYAAVVGVQRTLMNPKLVLNDIDGIKNILDLAKHITVKIHDVRKPLPFKDESFDGCFSHMLYCMAFTTKELVYLSSELHRVLKPGGINIYTVRHTGDADYKTGVHRGEDLYETGGFIVHFFSKEKIKQLSTGFEIVSIDSFEEGSFPRKLFRVTLRKK